MFCSRCGKEVEEGNRFCQVCGQEIGAAVTTAASVVSAPPPPYSPSSPVASAPASPYAGFWVRFAAFLIDRVIIGVPWAIVFFVSIASFGGFRNLVPPNPPTDPREMFTLFLPVFEALAVASLVTLILAWLYFAGMESSKMQATLGKSAMSLKVADTDGRRLSFGHATGRFFAKIVSELIPFAIGFIMAGFTAKKQALHDLIAGTLVLKG